MGQPLVEFLLDSVILIDRFNKIPEAKRYVAEARGKAAISVVTVAEALVEFSASSQVVAARSLERFPLLEITGPVANLAATLRREQGWKLPDAFQAALAQHHDLKLVTRNTKDFPPERYGFVVVPYMLETEG